MFVIADLWLASVTPTLSDLHAAGLTVSCKFANRPQEAPARKVTRTSGLPGIANLQEAVTKENFQEEMTTKEETRLDGRPPQNGFWYIRYSIQR